MCVHTQTRNAISDVVKARVPKLSHCGKLESLCILPPAQPGCMLQASQAKGECDAKASHPWSVKQQFWYHVLEDGSFEINGHHTFYTTQCCDYYRVTNSLWSIWVNSAGVLFPAVEVEVASNQDSLCRSPAFGRPGWQETFPSCTCYTRSEPT